MGGHAALLRLPTFRDRTPTGVHGAPGCVRFHASATPGPSDTASPWYPHPRTTGTELMTKNRHLRTNPEQNPQAFLGFTEEAASPHPCPKGVRSLDQQHQHHPRTCQKRFEFCLLPAAEP